MKSVPYIENVGSKTLYTIPIQPAAGKSFRYHSRPISDNSGVSEGEIDFSTVRLDGLSVKEATVGDPPGGVVIEALALAPKQFLVVTPDRNLATRLAKALRHAASLCGAQPDPF